MSHTKGPWRIVPRNLSSRDASMAIIADADSGWDDDDNVEAYGGHLIAESVLARNADVIAATPELLAALAELVDLKAMKAGITTNAGIEEYERRKGPAWEAARAAVAKARGES